MARLLAYKRADRQVVTVNTVDVAVTALGGTIASADTLADFPNRSENVVCQFRGDYYVLYRSTTNEIRLSVLDINAGTWSDVAGFTAVTTASGTLVPIALHVVKDRLVAIWTNSDSAGIDAVHARRSASDDGAAWSAPTSTPFPTQPTNSKAGASIVWHNAIFFTTAAGIGFYDPASDTFSTAFDQGDDSAITGQVANFGSFSFLDGDLYYALATSSPVGAPWLYKLEKTWSLTSPTPTWVNTGVVIPGTGGVVVNNDTGNYSLFVNRNGVRSLAYSGSFGSKLIVFNRSSSSFSVDDLSSSALPTSISGEPNLGFSYFVDDRRRNNEQHRVLVRYRPSIPQAIVVFDWDGVNAFNQIGSLDDGGAGLDLMLPDTERCDFRLFTDNQPSCFIDDMTQPFPGRVRIDYTVKDKNSRPIDVIPEYSIDGQSWNEMSHGDGDSGTEGLPSSSSGQSYFFHWDAWVDLDGDYDNVDIRVVARIAGV